MNEWIKWAGTIAFTIAAGAWGFMLGINNQANKNTNDIAYLNREVEACVRKDVYEVDKMLMNERFRR